MTNFFVFDHTLDTIVWGWLGVVACTPLACLNPPPKWPLLSPPPLRGLEERCWDSLPSGAPVRDRGGPGGEGSGRRATAGGQRAAGRRARPDAGGRDVRRGPVPAVRRRLPQCVPPAQAPSLGQRGLLNASTLIFGCHVEGPDSTKRQ